FGNEERNRALNTVEMEWKQRIFTRLLTILDLSLIASVEEAQAREQIRDTTTRLLVEESAPLSLAQRQLIVRQIEDEVLGHGPLEPLLADPSIADILVNGPHKVYIERRGKLELTQIRFHDNAHLMNIIDRIVSAVGRRVDESSPMCDARLQDGSRVNVIIPPLALDGATLSIRRFGVEVLTVDDLIRLGTLTDAVAQTLRALVRLRMNVLISGGTGAGKTTLLNIMSSFIPSDERIVTIEDSAELQLRQPHIVRLETRPPNIEGRGEVSQRDLVRNSLRMRPDRIVVGEVRGAEALDMLQAMNTGHDGSLTTVHANTPRDALTRVETMVSMTGIAFPMKALRTQIASAIHIVVQTARHEDGKRRVTSVQEINGMEGEVITMSEIFSFVRAGIDANGNVLGQLRATGIVPAFFKELVSRGIELPVSTFQADGRGR
ncbi:MAG: CpaF family protein, partial [Steroidobacteraceae bacterium]